MAGSYITKAKKIKSTVVVPANGNTINISTGNDDTDDGGDEQAFPFV